MDTAQRWRTLRTRGITGSTLKVIAMVSMLLDHIGVIVLQRMLVQRGLLEVVNGPLYDAFIAGNAGLYYTLVVLRCVGRMAMPIFCFLAVEGFLHTRSLRKYLGRLFLFALLSEIPFELAFVGMTPDIGFQNVFFTLLLGLLAIAGIRAAGRMLWPPVWRALAGMWAVVMCGGAAVVLRTDYDVAGVLAIVALYLFRRWRVLAAGLGCAALLEIPALASLVPIGLYNGQRGRGNKWLFYVFYPAHILLLYALARALGLG